MNQFSQVLRSKGPCRIQAVQKSPFVGGFVNSGFTNTAHLRHTRLSDFALVRVMHTL